MRANPFLEPRPMWFVGGPADLLAWLRRLAAMAPAPCFPVCDTRPFRSTRARTPAGTDTDRARCRHLAYHDRGAPLFLFLSGQIGQFKLWQWPQYLAMFDLGIVAAQRRWLHPVPDRIWRRCGAAALLATVAALMLLLAIHLAGDSTDVLKQRLHWAATLLAVIEGPLAVGACVWLLGAAQRSLQWLVPGASDRSRGKGQQTTSHETTGLRSISDPLLRLSEPQRMRGGAYRA